MIFLYVDYQFETKHMLSNIDEIVSSSGNVDEDIEVTSSCDKTSNKQETFNEHISLQDTLQYAVALAYFKAYFLCSDCPEGLDVVCKVEVKLEGDWS